MHQPLLVVPEHLFPLPMAKNQLLDEGSFLMLSEKFTFTQSTKVLSATIINKNNPQSIYYCGMA